jgi:hypothetical protein
MAAQAVVGTVTMREMEVRLVLTQAVAVAVLITYLLHLLAAQAALES